MTPKRICCTCIFSIFYSHQCRTVKTLGKNLKTPWGRGKVEWCNTMRGLIEHKTLGRSLSNDVMLWGKSKTLWSTETVFNSHLAGARDGTVFNFSFPLYLCVHSFYIVLLCLCCLFLEMLFALTAVFLLGGAIGFPHLGWGCDKMWRIANTLLQVQASFYFNVNAHVS